MRPTDGESDELILSEEGAPDVGLDRGAERRVIQTLPVPDLDLNSSLLW